MRAGKVNITDAWVDVTDQGRVLLKQCHITPYAYGHSFNHQEDRVRELLLKRREIHRLSEAISQKGFTAVLTRIYLKGRWIKCEIAVGRGKRDFDKRQTTLKREADREIERALKHSSR